MNTTQAKEIRLPFKFAPGYMREIVDASDKTVANVSQRHTADFILVACNSHHALVCVVKEILWEDLYRFNARLSNDLAVQARDALKLAGVEA